MIYIVLSILKNIFVYLTHNVEKLKKILDKNNRQNEIRSVGIHNFLISEKTELYKYYSVVFCDTLCLIFAVSQSKSTVI